MSQSQRHILLVEDDETIRDTLFELLEEEGFVVCVACHGKKAMDLLTRGCRPDVILLDLMMPVMDGWQVLRLLRGHPDLNHIPVVVISAARDGMPEGASNFLHKPVDLSHLLDTVDIYCHPSALQLPPQAAMGPRAVAGGH